MYFNFKIYELGGPKMGKTEKIEKTEVKNDLSKTKEKYDKLKSENKLNVRSSKSRDIMTSPLMSAIKESWEVHVTDNKTEVPMDIIEISKNAGINLDFNHIKDKFRRGCEIYALSQLYPEEMTNIRGFYGSQTTEVLRKHFQPSRQFRIESNADEKQAFLSIDLSEVAE